MTLVQIQNPIPAWHQSTELLTSCPKLYVTAVIENNPQPGGLESARGNQVHQTGASYIAHCALKGVSFDLKAFDELAAGAGPLAARILSGMRDSFEVDFTHVLATELTLSLDARGRPTDVAAEIAGHVEDSGEPPVITGTLDGLYSFPVEAEMRIDDLKTHPRPFDPSETLQAKTYALLVFLHFPWVVKVKFRLIFVRYKNVTREVEFTREQLPDLVAAIKSARDRQKKIHEDYNAKREIAAIAGSHCQYCPLLTNLKCPIAEYNANMQFTPEERLNFNLWYSAFSRANNAALKAHIQASGRSVILKDYNGKAYRYGPEEKEAEVYPVFEFTSDGLAMRDESHPYLPIVDLLVDYAYASPGDTDWMKNVAISSTSLKKYLKTNKRSFLDQAVEDAANKVTKVSLRVSKPLDAVPDEEDEDDEEWEDEEL